MKCLFENVPLDRDSVLKEVCCRLVTWSSTSRKLKSMSTAYIVFAPGLVFCFHRTSLLSLDNAQSCKSVWNSLFIVLSVLSKQVLRVIFRKASGVILSWGLFCAAHFLMSLSRILGVGSRLMKRIIGVVRKCWIDDSCYFIWPCAKCVLHQSLNPVCFLCIKFEFVLSTIRRGENTQISFAFCNT